MNRWRGVALVGIALAAFGPGLPDATALARDVTHPAQEPDTAMSPTTPPPPPSSPVAESQPQGQPTQVINPWALGAVEPGGVLAGAGATSVSTAAGGERGGSGGGSGGAARLLGRSIVW